jgi:hypothetical protein
MSEDRRDIRPGPQPPPAGEDRLAGLAARLGLELPLFVGPIDAFRIGEEPRPEDPIYLGGDLQAIHPDTVDRRPAGRDPSLDAATVTIDDQEHPSMQAVAVEGIWCLLLRENLVDSAPYLMIHDTEGRLRTWLLLPPAHLMIGIGHFWLPQIKPPSGLPGDAGPGGDDRHPTS